jgi:hypothetical protein
MNHVKRNSHNDDDDSSSTTMMDEDDQHQSVALLINKSLNRPKQQEARNENRTKVTSPCFETLKEIQSYENDKLLPLKKRTRVLVPETAVSPATQTLNELNGMDLLEDNLYTQLSQVSYSQALSGGMFGRDDHDDHADNHNSNNDTENPPHRQIMEEERFGTVERHGEIAAVYVSMHQIHISFVNILSFLCSHSRLFYILID